MSDQTLPKPIKLWFNGDLMAWVAPMTHPHLPSWNTHPDDRVQVFTAEQVQEMLKAQRDAWEADAARYRWLRDVSVPPHNFYLSVPIEFDGVKFTRAEVDAAIDAAIKR